MPFTLEERVKIATKVLAAGVIDSFEDSQWYESRFSNAFKLLSSDIYSTNNTTGFGYVVNNPASNLADAQAAAAASPSVIEDWTQGDQAYGGSAIQGGPGTGTAVRLTPVTGTSDAFGFSTYVALVDYNDFSSARLDKWIKPQAAPLASGAPSIGYAVSLYEGDPNNGGTLISTAAGQGGTPAEVGWFFNADAGLLFLAEDFRSTITDPYIVGFRYIGDTVDDIASSSSWYVDLNGTWVPDIGSPSASQTRYNDIEAISFPDGADTAIYIDVMVPPSYDPGKDAILTTSWIPSTPVAGSIVIGYEFQTDGTGFPNVFANTNPISGTATFPVSTNLTIPAGSFSNDQVVTFRVARLGDPAGFSGSDTYTGGGALFLSAYLVQ